MCRRQFPIKIVFAMTIKRSQGQRLNMLEYIHHQLVLPMASSTWHLPDPLHLLSLLQLLQGSDNVQKKKMS